MLFHSTRGNDNNKTFEEVLMQGLADDGGLFMPDSWPQVDLDHLKSLKSFIDVAKYIVPMYTDSSFSKDEVHEVLENTWHDFEEKDYLKIVDINKSLSVLELFHGPTAAFKDFGLQLAAAFFNKTLVDQNKTAIVFGATSGDTGSAAIDACKEFRAIKSFILIPDGNMSEIQRKQMTTVDKSNVFPILASGTFDDCQDVVKKGFKDRSFLKDSQYLLAVNSINWVRIIGQICYYFYAALKANEFSKPLNFSVPTGNFGNVFACYAASKMGMPLSKIIVAVNSNDILHRFFKDNDYSKDKVSETISPSMDIQISSNFERLLFEAYNRNSLSINNLMDNLKNSKEFKIEKNALNFVRNDFLASSITEQETKECISDVYKKTGYILDPHTAVGYAASRSLDDKNGVVVTLGTAHPSKFPIAVEDSIKIKPDIPDRLKKVLNKTENFTKMEIDLKKIKNFISINI